MAENKNTDKKDNWFEKLLSLSEEAKNQGHAALARELENVAVNHTPEVQ